MALTECPVASHPDGLQPLSSFPCPPIWSTCNSAFTLLMGFFLTKNQITVTFPHLASSSSWPSGQSQMPSQYPGPFIGWPQPPFLTHLHLPPAPHRPRTVPPASASAASSHSTFQHTMSFGPFAFALPQSLCLHRAFTSTWETLQVPLKCPVFLFFWIFLVSFDPLMGLWAGQNT